jgi:hypothetical protein
MGFRIKRTKSVYIVAPSYDGNDIGRIAYLKIVDRTIRKSSLKTVT